MRCGSVSFPRCIEKTTLVSPERFAYSLAMDKGGGGAAASTLARDLGRLVVLGLLTALAMMLCERWSEAGVIAHPGGSREFLQSIPTP